jgi:hypothetical protein
MTQTDQSVEEVDSGMSMPANLYNGSQPQNFCKNCQEIYVQDFPTMVEKIIK